MGSAGSAQIAIEPAVRRLWRWDCEGLRGWIILPVPGTTSISLQSLIPNGMLGNQSGKETRKMKNEKVLELERDPSRCLGLGGEVLVYVDGRSAPGI